MPRGRQKPFGKFIAKPRTQVKQADESHVKRHIVGLLNEYPGDNALLIELLSRDYQNFNNKTLDEESLREIVSRSLAEIIDNEY